MYHVNLVDHRPIMIIGKTAVDLDTSADEVLPMGAAVMENQDRKIEKNMVCAIADDATIEQGPQALVQISCSTGGRWGVADGSEAYNTENICSYSLQRTQQENCPPQFNTLEHGITEKDQRLDKELVCDPASLQQEYSFGKLVFGKRENNQVGCSQGSIIITNNAVESTVLGPSTSIPKSYLAETSEVEESP
jgi:hypothetical protein